MNEVTKEAVVLGGILLDNEVWSQISETLAPSGALPYRWIDRRHRLIFKAMKSLAARNQSIDLVYLTDFLGGQELLGEVGGASYIASLVDRAGDDQDSTKIAETLMFPHKHDADLLSDEKVEEVLAALNIVDVVREYIPLEKRGKMYVGCCPDHGEKEPSFTVSEETQRFNCLGCEAEGDLLDFLVYAIHCINSVDFQLKRLANKHNIPIGEAK